MLGKAPQFAFPGNIEKKRKRNIPRQTFTVKSRIKKRLKK